MSKDKQTIMIVDDDPTIAHLVTLYLEKEGTSESYLLQGR